jgi:aryl-phospho-beta-D-glucosidase BglC (GH1 family)
VERGGKGEETKERRKKSSTHGLEIIDFSHIGDFGIGSSPERGYRGAPPFTVMSRFLATLALALMILVPRAAPAAETFVGVKGPEIVSPDGQPLLLKGVNLGNWLVPEGYMFKTGQVNSPRMINDLLSELVGPSAAAEFWKKYLDTYVTEADIHFLKAAGANCLRVPFNYRLFTSESYLGTCDATRGFTLLDRLVGWCKAEQIYLILDMHAAPGGQTGDNIDDGYGYPFLFDSEPDQALATDIWKQIATHYANEPTIIGYDLLNEPIAPFFDKDRLNTALEPLYKRIAAAIREVDQNHLLFLGGAQWDQNFTVFGKPFDKKTVYTFHTYWTGTTPDVIEPWLDFRSQYNVPIYCGETGENNDAWIHDFRDLLDQAHIGWTFWPYKKMESPSCMVTFDRPDDYHVIMQYAGAPRGAFVDIRKARPESRDAVKKALAALLENCRFENCKPNEGYIKALGFKVPVESAAPATATPTPAATAPVTPR